MRAQERPGVDDLSSFVHLRPEGQGDQHAGAGCAAAAIRPGLGSGNTKIQPISIQNVAKAFRYGGWGRRSIGKSYDLCGPEAFTWNELYDKLQGILGTRKKKVHLPLPIARIQATIFETILANPPITRDQLFMLEEDNVGDPRPAEREFVLRQEKFEEGIARYLKAA
jgi:uncharacterized protein YbjT (DUF2867 family)